MAWLIFVLLSLIPLVVILIQGKIEMALIYVVALIVGSIIGQQRMQEAEN